MIFRAWLCTLFGLAVLGWAATGITLVAPFERGVVRRFGKMLEPLPPGPHWLLPWGIDRVDKVAVDRVRTLSIGTGNEEDASTPRGQLVTGDHNLVQVEVAVQWRVDPSRVLDFAPVADRAETILAQVVEGALGEWAGERSIDPLLLEGKVRLASELVPRVQQRLDMLGMGILITDARAGALAPPDEVKGAFDLVARSEAGRQTLVTRARQEAETRNRAAQAEAYRVTQEAQTRADNLGRLAAEDASRFLSRLANYRAATNPQAFLLQVWEEERGRVFSKLRENNGLGLLDHHLSEKGLDLQLAPLGPKR